MGLRRTKWWVFPIVVFLAACGPTETNNEDTGSVVEPDGGADAGTPDTGDEVPGTRAAGLHDPTGYFSETHLEEMAGLAPLGEPPPAPTNAFAEDEKAAHFGQFLFYDTRLSGDGEVSCATCHRPDHGFAAPDKLAEGMGTTARHAPTILNAAYQKWMFWDGRADSFWSQVVSPLEAPNEQGFTRLELAHLIDETEELRQAYTDIFGALPDGLDDTDRFPEEGRPVPDQPENDHHKAWASMNEDDQRAVNEVLANVAKAIGAYERKLVSGHSKFDRFVEGLRDGDDAKRELLNDQERRGLKIFVGKGNCTVCHFGNDFSDGEFHNLGLPRRPWLAPMDLGRYEGVPKVKNDPFNALGRYSDDTDSTTAREVKFLAQKDENRGQMKTPTLRNVSKTPPYMHGGHFETLREVVDFYNELGPRVRVGHREESLEPLGLSDEELDALVAFLKTLDGEELPATLKEQPTEPLPQ